ncbi:MAG: LEPR-XLL domain-containing protein, partial [Phycisphaerae bacterium]|nr:LEPR-XLL domain-containing protein [Phycisphaerae bacterium]
MSSPTRRNRKSRRRHISRKALRARSRRRSEPGRYLGLEALEPRLMLSAITVDTLDDIVAADGMTSLREAVTMANDEFTFPGADSIDFDAGLAGGTVLLDTFQVSAAGLSALHITSDVTISAASIGGLTLDIDGAAPDMRLFYVDGSGSLTLDGLLLTGGTADGNNGLFGGLGGGGGGGGAALGGGIYVDGGSLVVSNSTLEG